MAPDTVPEDKISQEIMNKIKQQENIYIKKDKKKNLLNINLCFKLWFFGVFHYNYLSLFKVKGLFVLEKILALNMY